MEYGFLVTGEKQLNSPGRCSLRPRNSVNRQIYA